MTKEELERYVNNDISNLDSSVYLLSEDLLKDTLEANEKFNLTAIKEEDKFRELMIYDSLVPLKYFDFENKKVLDVGTGAGFPGLPLAISSKGDFTLLDSTKKKIDHINNLIEKYQLKNAKGYASRAEEFTQNKRGLFDFVTARAVAPLNILLELCTPFLKVGGTFIAMKSSGANQEVNDAKNALKKLGLEVIAYHEDELPLSKEKRTIIEIKKIKDIDKKYPREYSEIKKKPL